MYSYLTNWLGLGIESSASKATKKAYAEAIARKGGEINLSSSIEYLFRCIKILLLFFRITGFPQNNFWKALACTAML
jgi:hypothetical protein